MEHEYDVLIIGGGVVGCAIARELSAYRLKIGVLEKNPDVGYETSARNTGVVHGGFAYDVGSLKAALCVEGNRMMGELAEELHFPFKRCGKILVGNTEEEYARLLEVIRQGEACGASNLRMVNREELHAIIPSVEGNFALLSENSGIVDPFLMTSALAENAAENGVDFHLSCEVCDICREDGLWIVRSKNAVFKTRWIINSAGAQCGKISEMLGIRGYRIIYSKGDYIVLDPRLGTMVPMPIYTVPSNTYMGIHVTVTTEGNLLLGPTAENKEDPEDYGTEQKNLDFLYEEAMRIWPHFTKGDYIRTYSGVLPKWVDENGTIRDFRIEIRDKEAPNAVNLIGIESPGLTASVPIARYVIRLMKEREAFEPNADFNPVRNEIRRFADCTLEEQEALIRENPDYGEIVCRCNKVTRAEILSAIHNPLGARTMAAVKYRTRCMMGRCQGGYCQMRIAQMLEAEAGLGPCEVMYARDGSPLFFGQVRG